MTARLSQVIPRGGMRILPAALFLLVALLLLLVALAIHNSPAPRIETEFGGATVDIRADRAWALLPGDCVTITWDLEGIHSLYVDGRGKIGWGEMAYCPTTDTSSLVFDITAENGQSHRYELNIRYFPAAIAHSLVLLLLISPFLIAPFYLVPMQLTAPIRLNVSVGLALLALLLFLALVQTENAAAIASLFEGFEDIVITRAWQIFSLVLAGIVFIPLVFVKLRKSAQQRAYSDFLAVGAFFFFVLLLFLPFGFDSIGQWEEWTKIAFLEGRPSRLGNEVLLRIFMLQDLILSQAIDSNSFAGVHILNFLVFWVNMSLFYGILRKLRFSPFAAFITASLFLVYPVNALLMSLRSAHPLISILLLLAAIWLVMDFLSQPGRLNLAGFWLALLFSLGKYEISFVIILVMPLLWLWYRPRKTWRNVNMTVIWYLVPALKLLYVLNLSIFGLRFYRTEYVEDTLEAGAAIAQNAGFFLDVILGVYRQTLSRGWREALAVMAENTHLAHTLFAVALAGIVMARLALDSASSELPPRKTAAAWVAGGLLFILPAIGIGMWIDNFHNEMWRLYLYVPFGAAVALCGTLFLLAAPIKEARIRKTLVIAISLLLMLPATSRLFVQRGHFVDSANAKARILWQIVKQAPHFDSDARVALLTDMSPSELSELGIDELRKNMFDSAIYLLYGESRPKVASLCIMGARCRADDISDSALRLPRLDADTDYSDIVIFRLYDDLSVELLPELPPELGGSSNDSYKPARLIDTSAPVPPRAFTMLASARRASANP